MLRNTDFHIIMVIQTVYHLTMTLWADHAALTSCFIALLQCCSYLVVLVHAEAAHFGLDIFADMFGGR